MKDIELNGVEMEDGSYKKGAVGVILGDNLGSHGLGGFVENFASSEYFCRFCQVDWNSWLANPLAKGVDRSVESYKEAVLLLSRNDLTSHKGIKRYSLYYIPCMWYTFITLTCV